jgi:hypothetical protein
MGKSRFGRKRVSSAVRSSTLLRSKVSMKRQEIEVATASGAVITLLGLAWYYVANVASLSEIVWGVLKETLFWSGIAVVILAAIIVSLRARENWWWSTAKTVTCTVVLSSLAYFVLRSIGGGSSRSEFIVARPSYFNADRGSNCKLRPPHTHGCCGRFSRRTSRALRRCQNGSACFPWTDPAVVPVYHRCTYARSFVGHVQTTKSGVTRCVATSHVKARRMPGVSATTGEHPLTHRSLMMSPSLTAGTKTPASHRLT